MGGKSMNLKLLADELKSEGLEEKIIKEMVPEFEWKSKHEILDSLGYVNEDYSLAIRNYEHIDDNIYNMFLEVRLYDKKKKQINYLKSEEICIKCYFNDSGFYEDTDGWGEPITRYYNRTSRSENHISKDKIHYIKNIWESEGIMRFDITDWKGDKKYATYAVHLDFGAIKKETSDEEMEKRVSEWI